ncbi:MAG: Uma2 family endonuclease [Saprospiraceae bacterium]|nr:Uma2 family endonuclease [Lewinella sp.]
MTAYHAPKTDYTIDEYLEIEFRKGERFEYYNGKLIPMPGGSIEHNRICRNLIMYLGAALEEKINYEVFGSDQKVYLPHFNFYLYPDAIVVTTVPETVENDTQAIINPVLIVEVASPSTAKFDRGDKFADYKSIPTFQEYVLVRQDSPEVNLFFREAPDLWRSTDIMGLENNVFFRSIETELSMERIYRKVQFK